MSMALGEVVGSNARLLVAEKRLCIWPPRTRLRESRATRPGPPAIRSWVMIQLPCIFSRSDRLSGLGFGAGANARHSRAGSGKTRRMGRPPWLGVQDRTARGKERQAAL